MTTYDFLKKCLPSSYKFSKTESESELIKLYINSCVSMGS